MKMTRDRQRGGSGKPWLYVIEAAACPGMDAEGMELRPEGSSTPCIMPDILAKPQVMITMLYWAGMHTYDLL